MIQINLPSYLSVEGKAISANPTSSASLVINIDSRSDLMIKSDESLEALI